MKPPEVFGIVIRSFGLAMTLYCFWLLLSTISLSLKVLAGARPGSSSPRLQP